MTPIIVNLALDQHNYDIIIGQGLLNQGQLISDVLASKNVTVITNQTIADIYLKKVTHALTDKDLKFEIIVLPDGEEFKTWQSIDTILNALLESHTDRRSTIIALGGGVIGDMAGFAASIYQRGIPFIQIPTTLLAQVDSSVGGKTAVNHPLGKNMVGTFHQPRRVIIDIDTLSTLPNREYSAGIAEIIKYGIIADKTFFNWLENNIHLLMARDPAAVTYAIEKSCMIKASVVMQDEKEQNIRAHLNYGHTFGHAIEAGLGYGTWLHGEAVAVGMIIAARASALINNISGQEVNRIVQLCVAANLPVTPPKFSPEQWKLLMSHDKKADGGTIKFVLLRQLGAAFVTSLSDETLRLALD